MIAPTRRVLRVMMLSSCPARRGWSRNPADLIAGTVDRLARVKVRSWASRRYGKFAFSTARCGCRRGPTDPRPRASGRLRRLWTVAGSVLRRGRRAHRPDAYPLAQSGEGCRVVPSRSCGMPLTRAGREVGCSGPTARPTRPTARCASSRSRSAVLQSAGCLRAVSGSLTIGGVEDRGTRADASSHVADEFGRARSARR